MTSMYMQSVHKYIHLYMHTRTSINQLANNIGLQSTWHDLRCCWLAQFVLCRIPSYFSIHGGMHVQLFASLVSLGKCISMFSVGSWHVVGRLCWYKDAFRIAGCITSFKWLVCKPTETLLSPSPLVICVSLPSSVAGHPETYADVNINPWVDQWMNSDTCWIMLNWSRK